MYALWPSSPTHGYIIQINAHTNLYGDSEILCKKQWIKCTYRCANRDISLKQSVEFKILRNRIESIAKYLFYRLKDTHTKNTFTFLFKDTNQVHLSEYIWRKGNGRGGQERREKIKPERQLPRPRCSVSGVRKELNSLHLGYEKSWEKGLVRERKEKLKTRASHIESLCLVSF